MSVAATALLFPGQGSQHVGMAADLYERSPAVRDLFAMAERVCDLPLGRYCMEGPEEVLRSTAVAQPALVAVELAALAALGERLSLRTAEVLERLGVQWLAGHSLGQYAAAAVAGAIDSENALRLAAVRGRLMAEAAPGAMAAVLGLSIEHVEAICRSTGGTVVVANDNAPSQVVISGDGAAVEAASQAARVAGARRAIPLNVSGAFHSPLMAGAARDFAAVVAGVSFSDPHVPLIGNGDVRPLISGTDVAAELRESIARPVRWRESLLWLQQAGAERAIECGPGSVLTGLARRTTPSFALHQLGGWADVQTLANGG